MSALFVLSFAALQSAPITEATLLRDYIDLSRFSRPARPAYTVTQASSYDRKSVKKGNADWFANADYGQYIRSEANGGRTEWVMMDSKGPGAVVRFWTPNPSGMVRFYFDGSSEPGIELPMADFYNGKFMGIGEPFAYSSSKGFNLYYPIPYAKSLKVTMEGEQAKSVYYQLNTRNYEPSARVESFQPRKPRPAAMIERVRLTLTGRPAQKRGKTLLIQPNRWVDIVEHRGKGVLTEFWVRVKPVSVDREISWTDPRAYHNVLRRLRVVGTTDQMHTIDAPLSDFFASGVGLNKFESLPMSVLADGTMICRFPMPFTRAHKIGIQNRNEMDVEVEVGSTLGSLPDGEKPFMFHAAWRSDERDSQPFADMEFARLTGKGWLVGSALFIENHRPEWWGEGDEKISVDGEAFPSTFGTGTEDFYGYGWCCPDLFSRPYHGQPRVDGPGNFGHTSVFRWQIADAIPYQRSLDFDIELWHWAQTKIRFSRMTYWYGELKPSQVKPIPLALMSPTELVPQPPVKGAIEGETFPVLSKSGGEWEAQGGFWELSSGKQLWWRNMKVGDVLEVEVPLPEPGTYQVIGKFCVNKDYGKHRLTLGSITRELDFYSPALKWIEVDLGEIKVDQSKSKLKVECLNPNSSAIAGNMFGLDYLMFRKK